MRMIYLPALERRVSMAQYVRAIKTAKAHPDNEFKYGLKWECSECGAIYDDEDEANECCAPELPDEA